MHDCSLQELEAEEERLWEEQVQAARSRAGAEAEKYRRTREVNTLAGALFRGGRPAVMVAESMGTSVQHSCLWVVSMVSKQAVALFERPGFSPAEGSNAAAQVCRRRC